MSHLPHREIGMTLIEALVALTLLALLSIGLVTAFRTGGRVYRQVAVLDASSWDTVLAQRFLRQALESAYPLRPHAGRLTTADGLEGTAERVSFIAPMPRSAGVGGFYRYQLTLETDEGGLHELTVRWRPLRGESSSDHGEEHSEVLLRGVDSLEWAYLAPADTGSSAAPAWIPSWTESARGPTLVRLRVRFPPGDRRAWPELIVAPRITDDAGCPFDSVSQVCRDDRS